MQGQLGCCRWRFGIGLFGDSLLLGDEMTDLKTKTLNGLRRVRWGMLGPYLALCAWALYLRLTDG